MLEPSQRPDGAALGLGASTIAAICWGSAGVLATLISVNSLVLSFWRMWIAAGLMLLALALRGRWLTARTLRLTVVAGALLALDLNMFFGSVKLIGVAVPSVIGSLQPGLVMVGARYLLGDRLDRWNIVWTAIAILGVLAVALDAGTSARHQLAGDLLAIGALLAWSAYFLIAKRAQPQIAALDFTTGVVCVAALCTSLPMLVSRQSFGGERARDWLWIVLLALVPSVGHLLMNWAHQHLDVSITSLIGSSSPILAAAGAYVVLHQSLTPVQVAGGLIGLIAISVVAARSGHPAKPTGDENSALL